MTRLIGIELIKLNWFGDRTSSGISAQHGTVPQREMPLGPQTKVRQKDKMKPALTQAVSTDITALRQLPLAEGCPGDWQALQLWCGHWGRHLEDLSRAEEEA